MHQYDKTYKDRNHLLLATMYITDPEPILLVIGQEAGTHAGHHTPFTHKLIPRATQHSGCIGNCSAWRKPTPRRGFLKKQNLLAVWGQW